MKFLTRIWFKKLGRDLVRSKLLTFALIILCFFGTGSFLALAMGYENLYTSYNHIYKQTNFADAEFSTYSDTCFNTTEMEAIVTDFVSSKYAEEIQAINFRLVTGTSYNITSSSDSSIRQFLARGRAIGIKWPEVEANRINDLIFTSGSYSDSFSQDKSILLESHFAQKFKISKGDILSTTILDQKFNFTVQGVVFSPEFLVIIPSKHDFLPTSVFGIIFLPIERLQSYTNLTGLANNVIIKMASNVDIVTRNRIIEEFAEVLEASIDVPFNPPVMQENQVSNLALRLDLETFEEIALALPIIVLGVAAVSIYITLGRTVQSQRRNIGIASCIGYFPNDIFLHYICFVLVIGGLGSILGIGFGIITSGLVTWVYSYFMRFPQIIEINIQLHLVLIALITGLGVSFLGGAVPAWNASRLTPRKALQTMFIIEKGSHALLEKIPLVKLLGLRITLPIRNLFRKRIHTLATITAIAAAVMIIIVSFAFIDSVTAGVNSQFFEISQYDMIIKYQGVNYFDLGVKEDVEFIQNLPGVVSIDPVLQIPSKIESNGKSQEVLITAWNFSNPATHNFRWSTNEDTLWTTGSMVVCSALANKLSIRAGSLIKYTLPFIDNQVRIVWKMANDTLQTHGRNETLMYLKELIKQNTESISFSENVRNIDFSSPYITVSGVSKEIWGSMVYTTLQTIAEELWIDKFKTELDIDLTPTSQLILKISQPSNITLLEEIKRSISLLEDVRSIELSVDFRQSVNVLMAAFNAVIAVFLIFSCLLAGASIFTTIYVNFQERKREIATMLTLGLSDGEFLFIMTLENLSQAILGIFLGIPIGLWIASWILDNILRLFYFEIIINSITWIFIWGGILGVVLLSQIPAFYKGVKLDLTVVTKELSS